MATGGGGEQTVMTSASNNVVASQTAAASTASIVCTYCLKKISPVGVKCAECPDDLYLCLHCLSIGAEMAAHRRDHDYAMMDTAGQFRLFNAPVTWTASETLALLDGVEHHGFGNWLNVAKCVPSRAPTECAAFFVAMFTEGSLARVLSMNQLDVAIQDHSAMAAPISLLPPVEMTLDEKRELGYYPQRDDFELEFDNAAEQLVSDLVFRPDDDEDQVAYKVWQIDRYRLRLANRIKHKMVARDYGLVAAAAAANNASSGSASNNNNNNNNNSNNNGNNEATAVVTPMTMTNGTSASGGKGSSIGKIKEQQQQQLTKNGINSGNTNGSGNSSGGSDLFAGGFEFLRPLSRYKSADEMTMLVENLRKERQLGDRIRQLCGLKKAGVTRLRQHDDQQQQQQQQQLRSRGGRESPSRHYPTRSGGAASPSLDDYSSELADMMTERERKMCHSMKMTYKAYFSAKAAILKDFLARRRGMPVKLRYPPGLDPAHRRQIIGLMTDNGWMDEDGVPK